MNKINLTGCGTALITPFRNGEVDYEAFAALTDRQVAAGIGDDAIVCHIIELLTVAFINTYTIPYFCL